MSEDESQSKLRGVSLPDAEALFSHLADAVYLIDPETSNIVWGNRKAWESLGMSREAVLNHSVLSLQEDVHGLPQWAEIAAAIRSSDCFRFNGRHRHQQGHVVEVEVNTTHFQIDGRAYFLSVARDITNRVAQESGLDDREKQHWFALNESSDGLWDWQIASGEVFFSPQLKRILGYGPDEMSPKLETWSQNIHPDDFAHVMEVMQSHLAGKRLRFEAEYRLRNRNGHYLWVRDRGRVCEFDGAGKPLRAVGMVQDITDRKQLELQLQELASHDPLTGLVNRREGAVYLESQVEFCRRMDLPLGLIFIDIDHFKSVNDVYGHTVGDGVICQVGQVLKNAIRASDMVCRWGGEEFIVVAPNTTLEQIGLLSEKLRLAVLHGLAGNVPAVTISLGGAAGLGRAIDMARLIDDADAGLYLAKNKGRNRAEFVTA